MPLKEPYAVKTVLGNTVLSLSADPGESFLIKDIRIYNPLTNYATLKTEKTTVGYFRVGGVLGSHLPFLPGRSNPRVSDHAGSAVSVAAHAALATHKHKAFTHKGSLGGADQILFVEMLDGEAVSIGANVLAKSGRTADIDGNTNLISGGTPDAHVPLVIQPDRHSIATIPMLDQKTILSWMINNGMMAGYPVLEGETFTITGVAQAGAIQVVLYEIYDRDDMKPEMPNSPRAKEYVFINYGNSGGNINVAGDTLFGVPQTPAEFPDFPFGKTVPARTTIDILAILASDFAPSENTGTAYTTTEFIKIFMEREVLFDEDRKGQLLYAPPGANVGGRDRVGEGWSLVGNYSDVDMRNPFVPPKPMSFSSGDEVLIFLTTGKTGAGQNIDTAEQEIGLIELVKRTE